MSDPVYCIAVIVEFLQTFLTANGEWYDCQAHRGIVGSRRLADKIGVEINLISFQAQPSALLFNRWNNVALVAPAQVSSRSLRAPLYGQVLPVFPPLCALCEKRDIWQRMASVNKQQGEPVRDLEGKYEVVSLLHVILCQSSRNIALEALPCRQATAQQKDANLPVDKAIAYHDHKRDGRDM